jgi:hypothetical protein
MSVLFRYLRSLLTVTAHICFNPVFPQVTGYGLGGDAELLPNLPTTNAKLVQVNNPL